MAVTAEFVYTTRMNPLTFNSILYSEVVHMISYPVALTASPYGVYRKLEPYYNPVLEARSIESQTRPK